MLSSINKANLESKLLHCKCYSFLGCDPWMHKERWAEHKHSLFILPVLQYASGSCIYGFSANMCITLMKLWQCKHSSFGMSAHSIPSHTLGKYLRHNSHGELLSTVADLTFGRDKCWKVFSVKLCLQCQSQKQREVKADDDNTTMMLLEEEKHRNLLPFSCLYCSFP